MAQKKEGRHADPERRREEYDRDRNGTEDRRFYTRPAWKRFRLWFLAQHPTCAAPGCASPAEVVDHVKTRRLFPELAYEEANCQALCKPCHDRKTVEMEGGLSKSRGQGSERARALGAWGLLRKGKEGLGA